MRRKHHKTLILPLPAWSVVSTQTRSMFSYFYLQPVISMVYLKTWFTGPHDTFSVIYCHPYIALQIVDVLFKVYNRSFRTGSRLPQPIDCNVRQTVHSEMFTVALWLRVPAIGCTIDLLWTGQLLKVFCHSEHSVPCDDHNPGVETRCSAW